MALAYNGAGTHSKRLAARKSRGFWLVALARLLYPPALFSGAISGKGFSGMWIIVACALALFAKGAMAENLVLDDPAIRYGYTYQTLGSHHFCQLVTVMAKAPMLIKLTAAFVTDDAKPKDRDLTVSYIVEAFVVGAGKNSQSEPKQVKVVAGRIISDIFHSDLHASKNIDKHLGASYNITSEGSLALFTNLMTVQGTYTLAVEFENQSNLIVKVRWTPESFDPSDKWMKCSIAIMEHRLPQ